MLESTRASWAVSTCSRHEESLDPSSETISRVTHASQIRDQLLEKIDAQAAQANNQRISCYAFNSKVLFAQFASIGRHKIDKTTTQSEMYVPKIV